MVLRLDMVAHTCNPSVRRLGPEGLKVMTTLDETVKLCFKSQNSPSVVAHA